VRLEIPDKLVVLRPQRDWHLKNPDRHETSTDCPACQQECDTLGAEIPDHEYGLSNRAYYVECASCGTVFQSPMPGLEELATYYPADYHSMTHSGFLNRVRNDLRIRRLRALAKEDGPILDFGCGDGAFLSQAAGSMQMHSLWGFEIANRKTIEERGHGAIRVVRGEISDLLKIVPKCSLITMNHVIEHLNDPYTTVTSLAERLLPGGIIEGQTPAASSLEHRVFGKRWSGYHAPRHTVVFSRSGLCTLLERCGLANPVTHAAFNPAGIAVSLGSLARKNGGRIRRSGMKWHALVAMATILAPIDLSLGRPGIVNFSAHLHRE
jgi:SAM-dependent methyltransferase